MDLKSNGVSLRRFEPCRMRKSFSFLSFHKIIFLRIITSTILQRNSEWTNVNDKPFFPLGTSFAIWNYPIRVQLFLGFFWTQIEFFFSFGPFTLKASFRSIFVAKVTWMQFRFFLLLEICICIVVNVQNISSLYLYIIVIIWLIVLLVFL